jgi:hypothetical protein
MPSACRLVRLLQARLSLVLSIYSSTVSWACSPALPSQDYDRRELAVYEDLLASRYQTGGDSSQAAEILLSERFWRPETTYQAELMQLLRDSVPGLPESAITAFRSAQSDTSRIPMLSLRSQRVHLLSDSVMREYFPAKIDTSRGWKAFRRAFPHGGGIVSISRAGLSSDGRWALIYAGRQSDWLAGAGYYYVLRFDRGVWRVVYERMLWVS